MTNKPLFMSAEHVAVMNRLLADAAEVKQVCATLERRYDLAYRLSGAPGGGVEWWQMSFDPHEGVRFTLGRPERVPDLTMIGDYAEAVRGAEASRRGETPASTTTVEGDESVLATVAPAWGAAATAASVDVTFPEV